MGKTKSWQTTAAAILAVVGLLLIHVGYALDTDETTVADWSLVIGGIVEAIGILWLGKSSRDDGVTSEGTVAPKSEEI